MKKISIPLLFLLIIFLSIRMNTLTKDISYDVNIRNIPSPNGLLIDVFEKGEIYKVRNSNSGWAEIEVGDSIYYTYREDLIINSIVLFPIDYAIPVELDFIHSPDFLVSDHLPIYNWSINKSHIQLLLLSLILIILLKGKKSKKINISSTNNEMDKPVVENKQIPNKKYSGNRRSKKISNKRKGDLFEEYIVEKFNKKYYRLTDWSSDKITLHGTYAESNMNPDLTFKEKITNIKFHVECKYRQSDNIIIDKKQLQRYRAYGAENKNVFIVIGTGGKPEKPENLYIIPSYTTKNINDLNTIKMKYKKKDINKGLYFDLDRKILL